jgi:hypothetical protein
MKMLPLLAAGCVAGALATGWALPAALPLAIGAGIVAAGLGAAALAWPAGVVAVLVPFCGFLGYRALLDGHPPGSLSVAAYAGLLAGALALVVAVAAPAELLLERLPLRLGRLALRIVASWMAAIAVLFLAFTPRGGVSAAG